MIVLRLLFIFTILTHFHNAFSMHPNSASQLEADKKLEKHKEELAEYQKLFEGNQPKDISDDKLNEILENLIDYFSLWLHQNPPFLANHALEKRPLSTPEIISNLIALKKVKELKPFITKFLIDFFIIDLKDMRAGLKRKDFKKIIDTTKHSINKEIPKIVDSSEAIIRIGEWAGKFIESMEETVQKSALKPLSFAESSKEPTDTESILAGGLALATLAGIFYAGRYFYYKAKGYLARKKLADIKNVTFKDIGGMQDIVMQFKEIISFLKEPKKFAAMGPQIPRGILLEGPPGVGKTLIARALANEAGCTFLSRTGSEFVEIFVGTGAARIRDLFNTARENKPAVIFIDEIDAFAYKRTGEGGGNKEFENTLLELLAQMDGIVKESGIIVVGATNRAEILDPALKRPGRFDKIVTLQLPNLKARKEIIELHLKKLPAVENFANINLDKIASQTEGFNSAELESIINNAVVIAIRRNSQKVENVDLISSLEEAKKTHLVRQSK